ncbi:response regulator [Geminocystis sp. CENA526]
MGGKIKVESEVNQGTMFSFTLNYIPVCSLTKSKILSHQKIVSLGKNTPVYRILIVDDNEDNRLLLSKLLKPLGFAIQEAVNGKEAVEITKVWHPDLIWMDIGMVEMDGYEATKLIREYSQKISYCPVIIALTAHAFMEQKEDILKAGCDDIVSKPFLTSIIFDKLQQFLNLEYVYESTSQNPVLDEKTLTATTSDEMMSPQQLKPLKILVAEDNRVNQKLILNFLKKLGYSADMVTNGLEVLSSIELQSYDIIFMDVEMPEMDGLTATKKIHEILPPDKLPVIIAMTAHDDEENKQTFREAGMIDFLPKPIKLPTLQSILNKIVS